MKSTISVFSVFFIAGIFGGSFAAIGSGAGDAAVLTATPSISSAFFGQFLYPTLCFLLGTTFLGVFLIPVAAATAAFFLSYAVAAGVQCADVSLVAVALLPSALFTIPCLFVLGTNAMRQSLSLLFAVRRQVSEPFSFGWVRFGICILCMTVAALVRLFVSPFLIGLV